MVEIDFTKATNSSSDPFQSSNNQLIKKQYESIVSKLKEDAYDVIDVEKFGNYANDPLAFVTGDGHDSYFIGDIVNSTLQCIPTLGQSLSLALSPFWPEDLILNLAKYEKGDIKKSIKDYKTEIDKKILDKTIETDHGTWNTLSSSFFENSIFTTNSSQDMLNLKKEIVSKNGDVSKVDSSLKKRVKDHLISLYQSAFKMSEFCKKQKNLNEMIDVYMQSVLIQSICIIQLNSFWYQLDLDPSYLLGNDKGEKSLREKYHDIMVDCLKNITKLVNENIDSKKEPLNKFYEDSSDMLLNSDMWLYPIPLIVETLKIPRLPAKDYGIPILTIPTDSTGPFIHRIDGLNMLPESIDGLNRPIPKDDPLTNCYGTIINSKNSVKIQFTSNRNVTLRIFGIYPKGVEKLVIGSQTIPCIEQEVPCLPVKFKKPKFGASGSNDDKLSKDVRSGYTTLKKTLKNVNFFSIDISQQTQSSQWSCVKFIELIITDPTESNSKELQKNEANDLKAEAIDEKVVLEEELTDEEKKFIKEYDPIRINGQQF